MPRTASGSLSDDNMEAFRKALTTGEEDVENAKERLKCSTLPGSRNRVRSTGARPQTEDLSPDDNTDEVMDMLVKSATTPSSRPARVRKRVRASESGRKSGVIAF